MAIRLLNERDWQIRLQIYRFFIEHERPPSVDDIARQFSMTPPEATDVFRRLDGAHAMFLDPGTDSIRMANPLSAVPTPYIVNVGDRRLYANCAWDSLGIPAMLDADVSIEAVDAYRGEPVRYAIVDGVLEADPGLRVHFALPFREWYADLIHT